ncbi:unannotated protein [freshwater metagenome]|uniref:Unannotated protein n=1 Tax=freshwater metagenome TaxID=449393 RepID=A0A6J6F2L5_9ZZZZ
MVPSGASLTTAAFATFWLRPKLRFDTSGTPTPHGKAAANPGAAPSVAVRFTSAAEAPAGTPLAPPTCTDRTSPATGAAGPPSPMRVSRMRCGAGSIVRPAAPAGTYAATSATRSVSEVVYRHTEPPAPTAAIVRFGTIVFAVKFTDEVAGSG